MESIVGNNPYLKWEGWSVVFIEEDGDANLKKNAAFIDSKWHKKIVFENIDGVWDIPDSILRKGDVQVR
jgi:hypothetical protein